MPHLPIKLLVVHCTATIEGKDYTVADIDSWHRQRGFAKIGYHWVIYRDGSVHAGRPESEVGAHVAGHNTGSIGISYVGGCDKDMKAKDTRTALQHIAMEKLIQEILVRHPGIRPANGGQGIHGHRDFAAKACPSFDATTEYKGLASGYPAVAADPKLPKPTSAIGKGTVSVKSDTLNVRSAPSANATIVGQLADGTVVDVFGNDGDWIKIAQGWVHRAYVVRDDAD